jgi:chromosomal replication initiator protein
LIETRSAQQIWQTALGELQLQVNRSNYRTWLEKTAGLDRQNGIFTIGVPNTFVAEYLDKSQRSLIEKVLAGLLKQEIQVEFQVTSALQGSSSKHSRRQLAAPSEQASLPLFNPRYTFESFIIGSCNQLAYAAALRVGQDPGLSYNPLFLYGGSGLGKTHLLHAIGNMAQSRNLRVAYATAEQYTNQLVQAIREKKTGDFHNKYRSTDMLLVDDVQFFSGKKQMSESFSHTFDALHRDGHQIAITSDCPPKDIPLLQEHLRSRFEWGLVADIQCPEFDTRLAILQAKAKEKEVQVSTDVLEFIALQIQQNIRSLEGSLNRVVAYSKLLRAILTPELAAQALRNISSNDTGSSSATPVTIIEAVANSFQIPPSDLKERKRDELTALARQVAMYLIRQETDCTLAEIGNQLGGRTPATITHAYQKIARDITNDSSLHKKVFSIKQQLNGATTY